ncbi:MAG: deoxyribodipyrimidine photo-lyase [Anaerolineae bacterium]|nr:deoxyribodipyrimidine photo-lyase [Anaerolineae bacterium]
MKTAIWWARRDLRLTDNPALSAALAHAEQVVPVFVLDPTLLAENEAAEKRVAFLFGGLRALDADLRARGSTLVVRRGDPRDELAALLIETGAKALYAEADVWPYGEQRDTHIAKTLPLHLAGGLTVHPSDAVLKADGTPYVVFTPFSRKWKALTPPSLRNILPAPTRIVTPSGIASLPIPSKPALSPDVPFPPGEAEAQCRLDAFLTSDDPPVYSYAETRDRMDLDSTSHLSPYLRFGMLSARQAVAMAGLALELAPSPEARQSVETWLNELIWREFYQAILHHFPHVLERSFRPNLQAIPWDNDRATFAAWCEGRTGYPVVDAAMRQLTHTGWMHNRARMIAASFLVKDLLIDWRWGERFFMQHLVDGDPAANNGGWQWTAGTGTDAAPYFRVFNPVTQGKKYNPQGNYVRRWVPELANVPDLFIHEPWKMPLDAQQSIGCVIGQDYPDPIVDHAWARERTLVAYARTKDELVG